MTDSLISGLITFSNFEGRCSMRIFLSDPIKLVKSNCPDPRPSASLFSQIENDTPQLLNADFNASMCTGVLLPGGFCKLSKISQSVASATKLLVSTSIEKRERGDVC